MQQDARFVEDGISEQDFEMMTPTSLIGTVTESCSVSNNLPDLFEYTVSSPTYKNRSSRHILENTATNISCEEQLNSLCDSSHQHEEDGDFDMSWTSFSIDLPKKLFEKKTIQENHHALVQSSDPDSQPMNSNPMPYSVEKTSYIQNSTVIADINTLSSVPLIAGDSTEAEELLMICTKNKGFKNFDQNVDEYDNSPCKRQSSKLDSLNIGSSENFQTAEESDTIDILENSSFDVSWSFIEI